ncbi:hypothetical protein HK101_006818 [Irineochytrium annulatum]|nr:hypothetical protein HK101_006818 [Irineochytrium annulatum]
MGCSASVHRNSTSDPGGVRSGAEIASLASQDSSQVAEILASKSAKQRAAKTLDYAERFKSSVAGVLDALDKSGIIALQAIEDENDESFTAVFKALNQKLGGSIPSASQTFSAAMDAVITLLADLYGLQRQLHDAVKRADAARLKVLQEAAPKARTARSVNGATSDRKLLSNTQLPEVGAVEQTTSIFATATMYLAPSPANSGASAPLVIESRSQTQLRESIQRIRTRHARLEAAKANHLQAAMLSLLRGEAEVLRRVERVFEKVLEVGKESGWEVGETEKSLEDVRSMSIYSFVGSITGPAVEFDPVLARRRVSFLTTWGSLAERAQGLWRDWRGFEAEFVNSCTLWLSESKDLLADELRIAKLPGDPTFLTLLKCWNSQLMQFSIANSKPKSPEAGYFSPTQSIQDALIETARVLSELRQRESTAIATAKDGARSDSEAENFRLEKLLVENRLKRRTEIVRAHLELWTTFKDGVGAMMYCYGKLWKDGGGSAYDMVETNALLLAGPTTPTNAPVTPTNADTTPAAGVTQASSSGEESEPRRHSTTERHSSRSTVGSSAPRSPASLTRHSTKSDGVAGDAISPHEAGPSAERQSVSSAGRKSQHERRLSLQVLQRHLTEAERQRKTSVHSTSGGIRPPLPFPDGPSTISRSGSMERTRLDTVPHHVPSRLHSDALPPLSRRSSNLGDDEGLIPPFRHPSVAQSGATLPSPTDDSIVSNDGGSREELEPGLRAPGSRGKGMVRRGEDERSLLETELRALAIAPFYSGSADYTAEMKGSGRELPPLRASRTERV